MSDKKISQLTGATTPLAGTEVLPVVQSGQTRKVSVDDLTAGKLVNTGQLTVGSAASPWSFVGSALDVAGNGSIFGGPTLSTVGLFIGSNVYWNGGYKYKVSGQVATEYVQVAGQHIWSTAPFGNANDPITFTQVMGIDASGNVGVNVNPPEAKFHVRQGAPGAGTLAQFAVGYGGGTTNYYDGSPHIFRNASASEVVRITGTGDVGINETAPDYKLDVNGTFGFTPGASVTPVDNGDVVFELTNNTTLTVKAKGSDGVVRSGTIILV